MTYIAIDGDTIACSGERIRILGVNTPEIHGRCPAQAEAARRFTAEVLRASVIIIEPHGRDRYGRTLAVVYVNSLSPENILAEWIISSGHGVPYGSTRRATPGRLLPRREDRC